MIRPGGTELTGRALQMAGLLPGSTVFDIGCGDGKTVKYLREKGYDASGIDLMPVAGSHLKQADAVSMPWEDGTADGLLFECSFSKMREPEQVLREAFRVLKANGKLIIADMIARREEGEFHGYLGRMETEEHLTERLVRGGFRLLVSEGQDAPVRVFAGNLILEKGTEEAEQLLGGSLKDIKKTSPGYVLLILEKNIGDETNTADETKDDACSVLRKLTEQAAYARTNAAYYREKLPDRIKKAEDIPFTETSDLRNRPEDFLCVPQTKVKRVVTLETSGTTGSRKRVFFTEGDLENTVRFFEEGMRTMVKAGETAGILFPGDGADGLPELIAEALRRLGVHAEICRGSADRIGFCRGKDFLTGMPADLFRLSVKDNRLKPKAVLLSGDYVPESLLRALKNAWNCEVFAHYGMTETGFGLAVECPAHTGLHIRSGDILVETADPENGMPVPAGKEGEIVITTLNREAMPLLRYRTGDLGILEEDNPCACGKNTPRFRKICGRKEIASGYPSIQELSEVIYGLSEVSDAFSGICAFEAHRSVNYDGMIPCRRIRIELECSSETDTDAIKKYLETVFQGTCFEVAGAKEPISTVLKKRLF